MEESRTQTREKAMFAIYDTLMYENGGMEYEPRDVLERVFLIRIWKKWKNYIDSWSRRW